MVGHSTHRGQIEPVHGGIHRLESTEGIWLAASGLKRTALPCIELQSFSKSDVAILSSNVAKFGRKSPKLPLLQNACSAHAQATGFRLVRRGAVVWVLGRRRGAQERRVRENWDCRGCRVAGCRAVPALSFFSKKEKRSSATSRIQEPSPRLLAQPPNDERRQLPRDADVFPERRARPASP